MQALESLLPASSQSSPVNDDTEAQPSIAATEDINNDVTVTSSPPVTSTTSSSSTPPSPAEPTPSTSSTSTLSATAAPPSDVRETEFGETDPLGCKPSDELDTDSSGKCKNGHMKAATTAMAAETCLGDGRGQEERGKKEEEEAGEEGRVEKMGVNGENEEECFLLTKMDRYDVQTAKKRSTSGGNEAEPETEISSSSGNGSSQGQKPEMLDRPVRTCAVLCAAFFFVYTANLAIQNLQSSLHQGEGLGITSLAVLYGSIIVFGSLSPLVISVLGAKRTLVVAFVCHALYTCSQFYPTFPTLLVASLLLGALAGPMWTAQGLYCTAAGLAYAGVKQMETHGALSLFNGIFFAFYEATQISGNLIASLVLTRDDYNNSHQHNKVCGAALCPDSSVNSTVIEQPETHIVYILLSIYLACNVIGLVLTALLLPPLPRAQEPQTGGSALLKNTTSCLSMLLVPRMLLLLPFFMAQAMNSGILLAEYNQKFVSCSVGIQWVGYVMTAFGVLTSAQAVALNYAAKVLGRRVLLGAAALADMAVNVAMLLWDPAGTSLPNLFILPAVSGFAEGIFQAQFNSLVAMVFPDHVTAAFATYHTSKATAFTLTFVMARFLCLYERLYVSLTLASLGLLGYGVVEVMLHRQKKREAERGSQ